MKHNIIIVVTNNYPLGGRTEEAFLKSEIPALASAFQEVVLLPVRKEANCVDISSWPKNVSFDTRLANVKRKEGRGKFTSFFRGYGMIALIRDLFAIRERRQLHYLADTLSESFVIRDFFKGLIESGEISSSDTVIYSFWFSEATGGLGLLPSKEMPRLVSRAHGYDLYNERVPIRSRFIRELSFRSVSKVLTCSKQGADYLSSHYPKWANKIGTLYLGTSKPTAVPPYDSNRSSVNFLTISRLEPVKRPVLTFEMIEALACEYPDKVFYWHVFGGGSLFQELLERVDCSTIDNLNVRLFGEMPNAEIHSLLGSHPYDWMIMLSESEGLPISIAEGLSYGIPAIATDVGGVKEEVIPGRTGILLSLSPSFEELRTAINPFFEDKEAYLNLRDTAKAFWEENLNEIQLKEELIKICKYLS